MPAPPIQHDVDYLFARQTTWGTKVTSNMRRLNCEPLIIDPGVVTRLPNRSYIGRIRTREAHLVDTKGGMAGTTARGILRREDAKHMIFSVMQDITAQSGTTPNFQTTFKFPQTHPDLKTEIDGSANIANWAGTFLKTAPVTANNQEFHDFVGKQLRLFWKQGQDVETRMHYEWMISGRGGAALEHADPGGSTVTAPEAHYDFYDINVFTIEGVDMTPLEFEILIKNNAFPVSVDKANDGLFDNWGFGPYEVEVKAKCMWTTAAHDVQKNMASASDLAWIISFGTSGQEGYLNFTGEFQTGDDTRDDEGGGQTKSIDLTGKLVVPTGSNWYDAFSVVVTDDNDFTTSI